MRTEPKNTYDQGESAILEFVDGPRDSKFMMTAKTIARDAMLGRKPTPLTVINMKKTTQFRSKEELSSLATFFLEREFDKTQSEKGIVADEGKAPSKSSLPLAQVEEIIALL